jgi:hypothetical protein
LKLLQRKETRPRRKNLENFAHVPSIVDLACGRALVEDAFNDAADERMLADRNSIDVRKRHG